MLRKTGVLFFLLLVAGFSGMARAQPVEGLLLAGAETSPQVSKDICWRNDVKRSFKKNVGTVLDGLNGALRGHFYSIDNIISSPRTIAAHDFSLVSMGDDVASLVCNATLKVTYKSRRYGTVIVQQEAVNFKIKEAEGGLEAEITLDDLKGYRDSFGDWVRVHSTSDSDAEASER